MDLHAYEPQRPLILSARLPRFLLCDLAKGGGAHGRGQFLCGQAGVFLRVDKVQAVRRHVRHGGGDVARGLPGVRAAAYQQCQQQRSQEHAINLLYHTVFSS